MRIKVAKNIKDGAEKTTSSAYNIIDDIKPKFADSDKNDEDKKGNK